MKKSSLWTTLVAICFYACVPAFGQAFTQKIKNGPALKSKIEEKNKPKPSNPNKDKPKKNKPQKDAPFDAGLTVLLAAGIGAGLKRAYDKRKRQGTPAAAEK